MQQNFHFRRQGPDSSPKLAAWKLEGASPPSEGKDNSCALQLKSCEVTIKTRLFSPDHGTPAPPARPPHGLGKQAASVHVPRVCLHCYTCAHSHSLVLGSQHSAERRGQRRCRKLIMSFMVMIMKRYLLTIEHVRGEGKSTVSRRKLKSL